MDISSLNLRGRLRKNVPVGPAISDDTALTATATVFDVDPVGGRVRVGIRGGDVWLPAIAGRYSAASLARVLLDATSARPVLVQGPVYPRNPSELMAVAATGSGTIDVTYGTTTTTIPAPAGSYTVGQSAWVELDPWGTPYLALFPSTATPPVASPGAPPAPTPATVSATVTISPQVTGTWRSSFAKWDSWALNLYGLAATPIYQGDGLGSGPLAGFAGYGDQIVNLHAVSIESIILTAQKNSDGNSAVLTVQGAPDGTRPAGAPTSSGDTASTASIGSGGTGSLVFTSLMRDAFRLGTAKGLVAIGSQYGGFGGSGTPGSFVLQITYTKNA